MPDTLTSVDCRTEPDGKELAGAHGEPAPLRLPKSFWQAIGRGALGRCPACGEAKLFRRFLKPVFRCPACDEDWRPQQADDFPAYVSIFLTGHIMAPVIIALVKDAELSVGALVAIIMPLAIVMMIGLLQPAKGAIITLQWWFGMHGFVRKRLLPAEPPDASPRA